MHFGDFVDTINIFFPPIVVIVLILVNYKRTSTGDPTLRRLFFIMSVCYVAYMLFTSMFRELAAHPGNDTALTWLYFLILTAEHLAFFFTVMFLDYLINRTVRLTITLLVIVTVLMLFQTVILFINVSTGIYYRVENSEIVRGPVFVLRYVYSALIQVFIFVSVFSHRKNRYYRSGAIAFVFLILFFSVYLIDDTIGTTLRPGMVSVCLLFAYLFIIRNNLYTDALTGIRNRVGLSVYVNEIENAQNKKPITFIILDIDDFKAINDNLGHVQGDRALVDVAAILRSSTHYSDLVARIGGDEFAIITQNNQKAPDIIWRIQRNIADFNSKQTRPYRLQLSIGNYIYDPRIDPSFSFALDKADKVMYENKRKAKLERQKTGVSAVVEPRELAD